MDLWTLGLWDFAAPCGEPAAARPFFSLSQYAKFADFADNPPQTLRTRTSGDFFRWPERSLLFSPAFLLFAACVSGMKGRFDWK
jgi:hypothetical protein